MALKIKAAVKPPELMKASFNLPTDTVQLLKAYAKAYAQEYDQPPDEDYLVNAIITEFIGSDKDFKDFLETHPEVAKELGQRPVRRGRKPKIAAKGAPEA